jgi:hypothetical protein
MTLLLSATSRPPGLRPWDGFGRPSALSQARLRRTHVRSCKCCATLLQQVGCASVKVATEISIHHACLFVATAPSFARPGPLSSGFLLVTHGWPPTTPAHLDPQHTPCYHYFALATCRTVALEPCEICEGNPGGDWTVQAAPGPWGTCCRALSQMCSSMYTANTFKT